MKNIIVLLVMFVMIANIAQAKQVRTSVEVGDTPHNLITVIYTGNNKERVHQIVYTAWPNKKSCIAAGLETVKLSDTDNVGCSCLPINVYLINEK